MLESKKPYASFVVEKEEEGKRLDEFLAEKTSVSRAQIIRMIDEGAIRIQGTKTKKGNRLLAGQNILLWEEPLDAQNTPPIPQPELPLEVLFESEDFVALHKKAGWPSHPLYPKEKNTLASALVARYPECALASEFAREGGLCHRLDRFTSGVILAARKKPAWYAIRQAFQEGQIKKEYLALCEGQPQAEQGEIEEPLLPVPGRSDLMQVANSPEERYSMQALSAKTAFRLIKGNERYSLLQIEASTGRRHQIRVHLASIGLPLVGDEQYGGTKLPSHIIEQFLDTDRLEIQGQFLHASKITLPALREIHQQTLCTIEAPFSPVRKRLLELLLEK